MRRLLLLVAVLALAACDSAGPEAPPALDAGFEATVTGALSRSLSGDAATGSLDGTGVRVPINRDGNEELTVLRLADADSDDEFVLVGLTRGALTPGTYDVRALSPDGIQSGFLIAYRYDLGGDGRRTRGLSFGDTGTVTVRQSDDDVIAGAVAFEGRVISQGGDSPQTAPVSVEGTFTAEVREIDRGGGSR